MKTGPPCERALKALGFEEGDPRYITRFKILVDLWDDGFETGDIEGYERGFADGDGVGYYNGYAAGLQEGLDTHVWCWDTDGR
jgi:hypothetical protein